MARTCALAMSDEVKTQNAPFLLRACIGNRRHGPQAWEFVRRNWNDIIDRFPRNTIVRMIETVKTLDRPTDVADVQAFFAEHPIEQAAKTLEQTLERRARQRRRTRPQRGRRALHVRHRRCLTRRGSGARHPC